MAIRLKKYAMAVGAESVGPKPDTEVSATYTGSEITNGYTCPQGVVMTGTDRATNGGVYTATYTPDTDHEWSDGTRTPVTVTMTIYYRWTKWDCYGAYADTTEWFSGVIASPLQWDNHALIKNDYPSFNSSNGTYDFSSYNIDCGEDDEWWGHVGKGTPIFQGSPYPTSFGQYYEAYEGSALHWYYAGSYYNRKYELVGSGCRHYPVYTYYKGSTNYGYVYSTSNEYPANGRHSDGFWYVKTW